ncbi:hypothetical protein POSPLADRAFT_1041548, partial [Postia placenta MAD-698-R-SB12]
MSVVKPFEATDMFKFNHINLDLWTETYGINIHLSYLACWHDLCSVEESPNGCLMSYSMHMLIVPVYAHILGSIVTRYTFFIQPLTPPELQITVLGKAEGTGVEWHGHVTVLSVAPEYCRLCLARKMTAQLERVSDETYHSFLVDLYVRCTNAIAIGIVYRRVREYYGSLGLGRNSKDEEDAFNMRKPLSRDSLRRSVRSNGPADDC